MDVKNEPIHHQQFGCGKVLSQTMSTVTVKFSDEYGTKKFVYPNAFESFLKLDDPGVKKEMDKKLKKIRYKKRIQQQRRAEEAKRLREEERLALLERKRKLAKMRVKAAKTEITVKE